MNPSISARQQRPLPFGSASEKPFVRRALPASVSSAYGWKTAAKRFKFSEAVLPMLRPLPSLFTDEEEYIVVAPL